MNAKYPIKLVSALLLIHTWDAAKAIDQDDWTLGSIRDAKDKTDHLHLIKTLQSNSAEGLRLQVDLSCTGPGRIAATIVARDTSYMWQRSASDSRPHLKIRSSTHVSGNAPSAKSYRYRGQPGHPKTKSLADDAMKENKHLRSLGVRKNPKIEVTPRSKFTAAAV
jgi:hypothetical protein